MEMLILDHLKKVSWMEKEYTNGRVDLYIRDSLPITL
jgi:hypothetical protein